MNLKKAIFLSALAVTGLITQAQIKFGAKAGLNLSNFSGTLSDRNIKPGFYFGAMANIHVARQVSIQPELHYSAEGSKLNSKNYNLDYIGLPVYFQYNHVSGVYGEAGARFGILMTAKYGGTDVKSGLNTTNFGIGFGLGYKMAGGFGIGARYQHEMGNILKGSVVLKPNTIAIGVQYTIKGKVAKPAPKPQPKPKAR